MKSKKDIKTVQDVKGALYQKYEFCIGVGCPFLDSVDGVKKCFQSSAMCWATAKDFHKWMKHNDFEIRRKKND